MVRFGNQEPTFSRIGDYAYSDGQDAIRAFKDMGSTFYPCQEGEMELFLARTEDDEPAGQTICISKPRQNGKSYGARHYAIWMAAVEGKNVLFSAHHGGTVRKMFKEIVAMFENNQELYELLKPNNQGIYRAQGMEGIYLTNGGMIEFSTRTNSLGRGATYDVIIVDEAQELVQTQLEALQPTTIASDSGDAQMIYLGTPPNEKCPGTVFADFHKRAHEDTENSIWWLEWAAEELGTSNDDVDLWYRCNPAMGYRIKERNMRNAADTTELVSFYREYLGWWSPDKLMDAAIKWSDWKKTATKQPPEDGTICFGIKFSPDGGVGSLCAAIKPHLGTPHVELVAKRDMRDGLAFFRDFIVSRSGEYAEVLIDGMAHASTLEMQLKNSGIPRKSYRIASAGDVVASTSQLENALKEGNVTHFDSEGQAMLDESIATSGKRKIGNRGGWGFDGNDTTPAEAAALALLSVSTTKRNPKRKQRIG